jgi:type II secretory pathway pseudopilin PulG
MKTSSHSTRGFSLGEAIASLALITILSAGLWFLVGPGRTAADVSSENARLNQMIGAVDAAYRSGKDFASISASRSVQEGWFPSGFDAIRSPWGTFDLTAATVKNPADAWAAVYQNVPPQVCVQLVTRQLSTAQWERISVGGADVTAATLADRCTDTATAQDATGSHSVTFTRWGGVRTGTSGLAPLCFDRVRNDPRGYEPGCTTDPLAYSPAPSL